MQLPGPQSYNLLLRFRDKHFQKSLLRGYVPCAQSIYVSRRTLYADIVSLLDIPFVIKPSNGTGSKRTQLIRDKQMFEKFMNEVADNSDIAFVAESSIQGREYCVDGLWENGNLTWFSIGLYNINVIDFHHGKSLAVQILSNIEHQSLYKRASELITKVMQRLGSKTTVFHLEFFDTEQALIFSECSARLGGGLIPEIIEYSYGIDWFNIHFEQGMGMLNEHYLPMTPLQCHAFVYLRSHAECHQTEEEYRRIFYPVELRFEPSKYGQSSGSYGNSGYIIVAGASSSELTSTVKAITLHNEKGAKYDHSSFITRPQ
ncbi:ATP-grasp domain-containing protein [Bartonella senegalensis]|uniref:ATP-grasp domain-containing protein n=1 Tax=Bartonella senegalensis TaxID=1468418 RepID=UPI0006866E48|nr:ATP-grasp domain-containing protein [Bartonella senegalensis]